MNLPEDQFITVGSNNTRYMSLGTKGEEIILVHGLGAFAESWMYNFESFAKHFRVYALDLAGFGKSDKPKAEYTYDYFATFLHDFMVAMKIEDAHLVGHSLGGGTVLQFTLKYPDKVKKLVIIGSAGLGTEASAMVKILSIPILGGLLTRPSRKGAANLLKQLVNEDKVITDEIIDLWYQMSSMPRAQRALLKTNRAITNLSGYRKKVTDPIRTHLNEIGAPTLVLWGRQDQMVPLSHAETAEKNIKNATTHIFDNCGHCPMIECPDEFNSQVIKYLLH
jgi:4,5:9,10-diseco-3-hydroxy-5,9,17-trioxoandrosta-1(10),2-diene-4-oate hydrolase